MSYPPKSLCIRVRRDKVSLFLLVKQKDTMATIKSQVIDNLKLKGDKKTDEIRLSIESADKKGEYITLKDEQTVEEAELKNDGVVFLTYQTEDGWEKEHVAVFESYDMPEDDPETAKRKEKGKGKA